MALSPTSSRGSTSGGGGGPGTLIQTVTLAAPGTITFAAIPQIYTDLYLCGMVRATAAAGGHDELDIQLNADTTTTNYLSANLFNNATTPTSQQGNNNQLAQAIPDSQATAGHFGYVEATLLGYTSTTWQKVINSSWGEADTTAAKVGENLTIWSNTAAVTQIVLVGLNAANLATGSIVRLYGRT